MKNLFRNLCSLFEGRCCQQSSSQTTCAQPPTTITQRAEHYITFLNQVGAAHPVNESPLTEQVNKFCSPHLTKIMNGKTLFTARTSFIPQLAANVETYGIWSIKAYEIIASHETNSVTISYHIATAKLGTFITLVVVKFDKAGLVIEINEVYTALHL